MLIYIKPVIYIYIYIYIYKLQEKVMVNSYYLTVEEGIVYPKGISNKRKKLLHFPPIMRDL